MWKKAMQLLVDFYERRANANGLAK